jgi:hypothetical protein
MLVGLWLGVSIVNFEHFISLSNVNSLCAVIFWVAIFFVDYRLHVSCSLIPNFYEISVQGTKIDDDIVYRNGSSCASSRSLFIGQS